MNSYGIPAASDALRDYSGQQLQRSTFFSALRKGEISIADLQEVFGQYYLWRNQFHRWFGVCIMRSSPFSENSDVSKVLHVLVDHISEEIDDNHHGKCVEFLRALGITDHASIALLPTTADYNNSFIRRFCDSVASPEEALAALAGREMVAPPRNRIIIDALGSHYNIERGLKFLSLHEELELEHFNVLWNSTTKACLETTTRCLASACREIRLHVKFWDDTYSSVVNEGLPVTQLSSASSKSSYR